MKNRHLKVKQEENKIEIPGSFAYLVRIRMFIAKIAKKAGLDNDAIDDIIIAVDEACSNIIEHNYKEDSGKNVQVSYRIKRKEFIIKIEDEGKRFDITKYKIPQLNRHIRDLKSRGMGIFLIRKLIDKVSYKYIPRQGNQLFFVKKISRARK